MEPNEIDDLNDVKNEKKRKENSDRDIENELEKEIL